MTTAVARRAPAFGGDAAAMADATGDSLRLGAAAAKDVPDSGKRGQAANAFAVAAEGAEKNEERREGKIDDDDKENGTDRDGDGGGDRSGGDRGDGDLGGSGEDGTSGDDLVRTVPSFGWSSGGGDEDDEAAYDTDMDEDSAAADAEAGARRRRRADGTATDRYVASCARLDVRPLGRAVTQLSSATLDLSHQGVGGEGVKALARSLARNTCVERLGLRDNCADPEASASVGAMLRGNLYITSLNLSENDLGTLGAAAIGDMLAVNIGLTHLTLSRCRLKDSDAAFIAAGIERNERLVHLDLSHNEFREEGAMLLGKAIGINGSLEYVSLAWNHVRRRGAVELCKALKRNYGITVADLSWNGLAYDGALAMGACLKTNHCLRELDVTSNRIDWRGASLVASGLRDNETLEVLKIGQNPLTMTGCFELLQAIATPSSAVEYLGLDGIPINNKIAYAAERVSRTREFALSHGGIIETNDVLGEKLTRAEDPLNLLMQFMDDRDLRPLDLFRTFDKGRDQVVTRDQFIQGLRKAKAPLELWQIRKVIEALDKDDVGNISYRKLNVGMKEKKLQNKLDDKKAKLERQKDKQQRQRLMNPDMPSAASVVSGSVSRRSSVLDLDLRSRSSRQGFVTPRLALAAAAMLRSGGAARSGSGDGSARFRMPPIQSSDADVAAPAYAAGLTTPRPASEARSSVGGGATSVMSLRFGVGGGVAASGSKRPSVQQRGELAGSAASSRRPRSTSTAVSGATLS